MFFVDVDVFLLNNFLFFIVALVDVPGQQGFFLHVFIFHILISYLPKPIFVFLQCLYYTGFQNLNIFVCGICILYLFSLLVMPWCSYNLHDKSKDSQKMVQW